MSAIARPLKIGSSRMNSAPAIAASAVRAIGCARTATILRSNGPNLESRIVDSDATALFVQSDNGLVYRVERRTVADIDHPGNIHLVFGALSLAASAAMISSSFTDKMSKE